MRPERVRFELETIYNRICEMKPDYESHKSPRQEHIVEVKLNKNKLNVLVHMNSYTFKIARDEEDTSYEISWYHHTDTNRYVKDGSVKCEDLAIVIQTIYGYLYGAFTPERGGWWIDREKPKHFTKNKRWA